MVMKSKPKSGLQTALVALTMLGGALACAIGCFAYDSPAYDRGCEQMARRDYDGAIISFGETIGFDMNNKDAYFKRGKCFYNLKNFTDAISDFNHILGIDPNNSDALLWKGTAEARLDKHEDAIRDYLAAIRLKPDLAKNFLASETASQSAPQEPPKSVVLGNGFAEEVVRPHPRPRVVVAGKTENEGAILDYEKAMDIYTSHHKSDETPNQIAGGPSGGVASNPNSDRNSHPRSDRGAPSRRKHKELDIPDNDQDLVSSHDQADKDAIRARIAKLNNALELDDVNQELIYRRGILNEQLGNLDAALKDFTRAISLTPMESKLYIARARVYHTLNQADLEQDDLQKAQSVDPLVPNHIKFVHPKDTR
jgi:tetratricopeptide (TPR) repeat protein